MKARLLAVALLVAACGEDEADTVDDPLPTGPVALRGTLAGDNGDVAELNLEVSRQLDAAVDTSEVDGSFLVVGASGLNQLSGSYDHRAGALTATGGNYTLTGTRRGDSIVGTFEGPESTEGVFAVQAANTSVYCGVLSGDATGAFTLAVDAAGNAHASLAEVGGSRMIVGLTGTVQDGRLELSGEGGTVTASGTIERGRSATGSWLAADRMGGFNADAGCF